MPSIAPARRVAVLLFAGATIALAQSTLPVIAPTSAPAPAPNSNSTPAPQPAHRASVLYTQGQLTILADNSSLNQILRDIARQTGMTITGSVADQRVYGKIGPASPAEVLTSLLDGDGANMMLRVRASQVPVELILTPRQTGPAGPGAATATAASYPLDSQTPDADRAGQPMQPSFAQQRPTPDNTSGNPPGTRPAPPSAADAETPQQVYQRMLQLQRSQPQQPAASQ